VNRDIKDLRQDYRLSTLTEDNVPQNPIALFSDWFEAAQTANILEPNAMTLATVGVDGKPSSRIVLLKGYDDDGFKFYTNYDSRKGQEISANPYVSLVFLWKEIERQVRIEGSVIKLSEEQSTAYYHSRPRGSQLGAWVSPQSDIIDDRSFLENNYDMLSKKYEGLDQLPKPPNWGGYLIIPQMIEFWQGRSSRLHDRLRYETNEGVWSIKRLAP